MPTSKQILTVLETVLQKLSRFPYPNVPNPEGCRKRASVAVVLRVRPAFNPVPASNGSVLTLNKPENPPDTLEDFFSQEWVQEGDPEILFIKRAGRAGDRWSGHVALPGGKRDAEDADDISAAIRETREEVGLDLDTAPCIRTGNLPERVVTTTWGRDALMVLCPYLFLLTTKHTPLLQPQPTEVASLHWVPLRALLSPSLRSREHVDTTARMSKGYGVVVKYLLRALVGKMMFSSVHLVPSESLYASSIPEFLPSEADDQPKAFSGLATGAFGVPDSTKGLAYQQPLPLWGLTLGELADFLDMLPPYNAVKLWKYPTFTTPDLRLFVYLFTRSLRANNAGELSSGSWRTEHAEQRSDHSERRRRRPSQTAVDATSHAIAVSEAEPMDLAKRNVTGISGLGIGSNPHHAVARLLGGYYERMNLAIYVFLLYRALLGVGVAIWIGRAWWRRRKGRL